MRLIREGKLVNLNVKPQQASAEGEPKAAMPEQAAEPKIRRIFPELRLVWLKNDDQGLSIA